MGYKATDPCLKNAYDDERLFVLMARDPVAPQIIMEWVKASYNTQPWEKIMEAIDCALEMEKTYIQFYNRKEAIKGSKKNPFRFEFDQKPIADDLFDRIRNGGQHDALWMVWSEHDYSAGIWIEFKKPTKLPHTDSIVKEWKKQ